MKTWTVSELIEKLQEADPDAEVSIPMSTGRSASVFGVEIGQRWVDIGDDVDE